MGQRRAGPRFQKAESKKKKMWPLIKKKKEKKSVLQQIRNRDAAKKPIICMLYHQTKEVFMNFVAENT